MGKVDFHNTILFLTDEAIIVVSDIDNDIGRGYSSFTKISRLCQ